MQDGYDLVIRVNPGRDELLMGRCIATDCRSAITMPKTRRPMRRFRFPPSSSRADDATWRVEPPEGGERVFAPQPVLRLSSLMMVREAVLDGAAASLLPGLLVEPDIAAGRLASLGVEAGAPVEIWALYSSRRLLSAKVRAFLDMLGGAAPA